jgi:hypothetical protein
VLAIGIHVEQNSQTFKVVRRMPKAKTFLSGFEIPQSGIMEVNVRI